MILEWRIVRISRGTIGDWCRVTDFDGYRGEGSGQRPDEAIFSRELIEPGMCIGKFLECWVRRSFGHLDAD